MLVEEKQSLEWLLFRHSGMLPLCDPMDCSTPGFPALNYLPEFAQTHVHWADEAIQTSHALFSSCPQSFPASGSFAVSQFFTSGGWNFRASASASVLPMNIQGWFPLVLTGWISLQSKGLSSAFSNTTVQKHQFFGAQPMWVRAKQLEPLKGEKENSSLQFRQTLKNILRQ